MSRSVPAEIGGPGGEIAYGEREPRKIHARSVRSGITADRLHYRTCNRTPAENGDTMTTPIESRLYALSESLSTVLHEYGVLPCDLAVVSLVAGKKAIRLQAVPGGDDSMIWEVSAGPIGEVLGVDVEGML